MKLRKFSVVYNILSTETNDLATTGCFTSSSSLYILYYVFFCSYFKVGREFTNTLDLDGPSTWRSPDFFPVAYAGLPSPPNHRQAVINACVFVHQTLHKANHRLAKRGSRTMAITPRYVSFCQFIHAANHNFINHKKFQYFL